MAGAGPPPVAALGIIGQVASRQDKKGVIDEVMY